MSTSTVQKLRHRFRLDSVGRLAVHVALVVICLFWILPTVGLVVTSFRSAADASTSGWWTAIFANDFSFDAYRAAFEQAALGRGLRNSFLITIPANIGLVSLSALLGYVFGVMKFKGRDGLFLAVIAMMALPPQMTLAPLFELFTAMGIQGHFATMWIFQMGFTMPLGILILRNFFSAIPREIFEAAEVDGASSARTFLSVALPVALPGLFSVLIFQFIFSWNDLLMPLVLLGGGERAPVTLQIAGLATSTSADNQTLIAASALVALSVPLLVFLALQRYFVRGFLSGAVKG